MYVLRSGYHTPSVFKSARSPTTESGMQHRLWVRRLCAVWGTFEDYVRCMGCIRGHCVRFKGIQLQLVGNLGFLGCCSSQTPTSHLTSLYVNELAKPGHGPSQPASVVSRQPQEEMCEKKDCSTEGYRSEVVACDNTHRPMDVARGPLHGVREELFMTNSLNGSKCCDDLGGFLRLLASLDQA